MYVFVLDIHRFRGRNYFQFGSLSLRIGFKGRSLVLSEQIPSFENVCQCSRDTSSREINMKSRKAVAVFVKMTRKQQVLVFFPISLIHGCSVLVMCVFVCVCFLLSLPGGKQEINQ